MSTQKNPAQPYSESAKERYEKLSSAIAVPSELQEWVGYMKVKYGEVVKVHQSKYTSWIIALLIVRYGEAETHWPDKFSEADIQRAARWFQGECPEGVSYITGAHSKRSILTMASLAVMVVLSYLIDPWFLLMSLPIFGTALTDSAEEDMIAGFNRTGLTVIADWAASTSYSVGDVVQPTTWVDTLHRAVVAGTSGGSEPSFATVIGTETTDNTVTWQTCHVGPIKVPIFWALFTAAPGETGGGTEVTGGAYARVAYQPTDANYDAPVAGTGKTANTLDILFPAPVGANWGTVVSTARVDRLTGTATMFSYVSLTASQVINDGDQAPKFAVGALTSTWA